MIHLRLGERPACRPVAVWGRPTKARLTNDVTQVTCDRCPNTDAFKSATIIRADIVHFRINGNPGCGERGACTGIVGNVTCPACRRKKEFKAIA